MTGFLMIILAAAGLVVAFEIGRLVHVHEEAGRCVSCAGTGRLRSGARCSPCVGTGRAATDRGRRRSAMGDATAPSGNSPLPGLGLEELSQ
jgi:hypothetical protein